MVDSFFYRIRSGKPIKFLNFLEKFLGLAIPDIYYRFRREEKLTKARFRPDYDYMLQRVNYYIRIRNSWKISGRDNLTRSRSWIHYTGAVGNYQRKMFHTAYYFDQHDVTRWFPPHLRWNFCPGDVYFTPEVPTVVKSRLLAADNQNSVVLKLDKLRHFMYVHDTKPFREKKDCAIFRGKIRQSRLRTLFLQKFFGHPMCDCGVVGKNEGCPDEWMTEKKTIREHLDYKFIIALEGNDVASNLKWVMSSNSLAVMTRPTCETWFMEGTLIPDYHYVEVKEDFSDFEEKLRYYINHPEKAEEIIRHAHEYVDQFRNDEREELLQLMVMERYFELSGQL
ncbi:MAG: lipopolysaccharide biosynthesis protein [Candidatus Paraprevotella stercoravium]|uniref:Lipopolysaccharide biosynthesis protein n=1 Tax=Candidatus Paraprevotella stercoravium TaxID=2838725 RepID=A0A9E2P2H9_9BACT|nr:lipopolysaccharide biosynthesis protein [Candidatus Paraprevotella stercoravium]